jgi:hypothetical protein
MRLFGKRVFKKQAQTAEQVQANEARRRAASISAIQNKEARQIQQRQNALKRANQKAASERAYQQQREQLERKAQTSTLKAQIAQQRAAKDAADRRRGNVARDVVVGITRLAGVKPRKSITSSRGRSVYVSTSHGLKKINPSSPEYAQYANQANQGAPPPVKPVKVKEDDGWGVSDFKW